MVDSQGYTSDAGTGPITINVNAGAPAPAPPAQTLPDGVTVTTPFARLGSYVLDAVLMFVTLGIGWIIWALTLASDGQTPGKKIMGVRVIGADTMQPVGFGKMFWMRGLVAGLVASFAITFTLGILLFMPFWDRRSQNLWDKVSNTLVVNDPFDAWSRTGKLT